MHGDRLEGSRDAGAGPRRPSERGDRGGGHRAPGRTRAVRGHQLARAQGGPGGRPAPGAARAVLHRLSRLVRGQPHRLRLGVRPGLPRRRRGGRDLQPPRRPSRSPRARPMTDRLARRLALLVLVGGVLLRFARLGADPYYYEWNGYITDEGRWIAHARALRLFGEIGSVGSALHLLLAPLFQAGAFVVFSIADVSLWSARLLSALTGSALLVGFWAAFRRLATPPALLLVLTMLAVEMDLVVLSRLAIPEMAAMALSFAAFLALVRARTRWGLVAGGLLVAAAIGTKATVLSVALIFGVLVVARTPGEALSRARALAAYAAGVLVPAVLAAGAVVAAGASGAISLRIVLRVLTSFVRVSDLYAVVGFPFDDSLAPTLALWSLAAWLGCLGGLTRRGASEPGADEVARFRAA